MRPAAEWDQRCNVKDASDRPGPDVAATGNPMLRNKTSLLNEPTLDGGTRSRSAGGTGGCAYNAGKYDIAGTKGESAPFKCRSNLENENEVDSNPAAHGPDIGLFF